MAGWDVGSAPISSTQVELANPSTSALVAALTGLSNVPYEARFTLGASTLAKFIIEHSASSTLADDVREASGHLGRKTVFTQTNASAQYVWRFKPEANDILRVRVTAVGGGAVGGGTAQVAGMIQLEKLA